MPQKIQPIGLVGSREAIRARQPPGMPATATPSVQLKAGPDLCPALGEERTRLVRKSSTSASTISSHAHRPQRPRQPDGRAAAYPTNPLILFYCPFCHNHHPTDYLPISRIHERCDHRLIVLRRVSRSQFTPDAASIHADGGAVPGRPRFARSVYTLLSAARSSPSAQPLVVLRTAKSSNSTK